MQVLEAAMVPPVRSTEQRMAALRLANDIRISRARLRRDVRNGIVEPADVVLDPPACVESMALLSLLTSQYRWGLTRARRFLRVVAVSEAKTLAGLTPRQRALVAAELRYAGSVPAERRMSA